MKTARLTAHEIYTKLENYADLGYYRGGCIDINKELDRLYAATEERDRLQDEVKLLLAELEDRTHGLDQLYADYQTEERRADRWERACLAACRRLLRGRNPSLWVRLWYRHFGVRK